MSSTGKKAVLACFKKTTKYLNQEYLRPVGRSVVGKPSTASSASRHVLSLLGVR